MGKKSQNKSNLNKSGTWTNFRVLLFSLMPQQCCTLIPETLTVQLALSFTLLDPVSSQSMKTRKIRTVPTPIKWNRLSVTLLKTPQVLCHQFLNTPLSQHIHCSTHWWMETVVCQVCLPARSEERGQKHSPAEKYVWVWGEKLLSFKQLSSGGLHNGNEADSFLWDC